MYKTTGFKRIFFLCVCVVMIELSKSKTLDFGQALANQFNHLFKNNQREDQNVHRDKRTTVSNTNDCNL